MDDIKERLLRTRARNAFYKDESRELINPDGRAAKDRIEALEGALRKARGQVVAFSLDTLDPESAVNNVAYIDDLLRGEA
jgi:hypothetical protein